LVYPKNLGVNFFFGQSVVLHEMYIFLNGPKNFTLSTKIFGSEPIKPLLVLKTSSCNVDNN